MLCVVADAGIRPQDGEVCRHHGSSGVGNTAVTLLRWAIQVAVSGREAPRLSPEHRANRIFSAAR